MSVYDSALILASQKVRLFPLASNSKVPAKGMTDYSHKATSDPETLKTFFLNTNYNSGIACGHVSDGLYLVGVDIDKKDGRDGFRVMEELDLLGFELPTTWSQTTPSGGKHFLFWSPVPIRQGTDVVGVGVDLRGEGGYLAGPDSTIDGKKYSADNKPIAKIPQWMIDRYAKAQGPNIIELHDARKNWNTTPVKDQVLALKLALEYLNSIPVAKQGERNGKCFQVTCKIKDIGVDISQIPDLLMEHWKCEPMLEMGEIVTTVNSAFKTGKNEPGILSPEKVFSVLPILPAEESKEKDFIGELNKRFFYCAANGVSKVYEEMYFDGEFDLRAHYIQTFHDLLRPQFITRMVNEKIKKFQISDLWLDSPDRREYKAIRFIPSDIKLPGIFNLWSGFHSKPKNSKKVYSEKANEGFVNFLTHLRENICDGHEQDYEWVIRFVAHMFQRPTEKPPIALVFHGEKGVGKNVFIDVLKFMIGRYATTISSRTTLTSNFNSIMEDKILIAFDEAFWSGDKATEGKLKSIITDPERNIERKGQDQYAARVYDRIVIMGNEDRLVNATADERRYAAFNVASHRRGDTKFFGSIMDGVRKHGSDELLMSYFLNMDLSDFDFRKNPNTQGLSDQKEQSLTNFELWWRECLDLGYIVGDYSGNADWPVSVKVSDFVTCYERYLKQKELSEYKMSVFSIGKKFKKIAPSCGDAKLVRQGDAVYRQYDFTSLKTARAEWNRVMKLNDVWE